MKKFASYIDPTGSLDVASYPLENLTDITVKAIFGQSDKQCPSADNKSELVRIPAQNFSSETYINGGHMDLISNNSASFVDMLISGLPSAAIPVDVVTMCPIPPPEPEPVPPEEPDSACIESSEIIVKMI